MVPYTCRKVGERYIVHKKSDDGKWTRLDSSGSHGSMKSCQRQVRALYAKESKPQANDSSIVGVIKEPQTLKTSGTIRINSPGGDLMEAISMANFIREHSLPTLVTGQAASAAVLPLIAGHPAKAMANSLIMVHNPRATLQGVYTAEELENKKEAIEKAIGIYADALRGRVSPMSALMVDSWLEKDTYFTAEEALAHGLIDEVIPVFSRDVNVKVMANVPDRIVAFLSSKEDEETKMTLLDVAEKFGIEANDDTANDVIESGIVAHVEGLQTEIADLKKQLEKKVDPVTPREVPDRFIAKETKYREQEIESVVKEGKISPAVAKEFEKLFCEKEEIVSCLSAEKEPQTFESVMSALKQNEAIISFGGKTGAQTPPHKDAENPLLKDIERREEEAKKNTN